MNLPITKNIDQSLHASLLYKSNCMLGEGPLWHSVRKSFFWVDIEGKMLYEYGWQSKKVNQWNLDQRVSLVIEADNDTVLLGLQGGLALFHLQNHELSWLLNLEKNITNNRTNDGACDAMGRIWIGTMDIGCKEGCGSLYCIDQSLTVQKKLKNLSISNGIAWSQNNDRMYHIDTAANEVRSYSFNMISGDIGFEKIAIRVLIEIGQPDGMCIDEEGMLWIAHWNGFGVYRWNPENGMLLEKLELPVPLVTSCVFGGENLDHLFITTAKQGLSKGQLEKYPDSGNVFIVKTGIKGVAKNTFHLNNNLKDINTIT